jgi:hypothetical protein
MRGHFCFLKQSGIFAFWMQCGLRILDGARGCERGVELLWRRQLSVPVSGRSASEELSLAGSNSNWDDGSAGVDTSSGPSIGSSSFAGAETDCVEATPSGAVLVAVSVSGLASCSDEPPCDSDPPRPEAPAAAPAFSNDFSWSPSTHVSVPSEFFAHTSSKWPIFAKKSPMPLAVPNLHITKSCLP